MKLWKHDALSLFGSGFGFVEYSALLQVPTFVKRVKGKVSTPVQKRSRYMSTPDQKRGIDDGEPFFSCLELPDQKAEQQERLIQNEGTLKLVGFWFPFEPLPKEGSLKNERTTPDSRALLGPHIWVCFSWGTPFFGGLEQDKPANFGRSLNELTRPAFAAWLLPGMPYEAALAAEPPGVRLTSGGGVEPSKGSASSSIC